MAEEKAGKIPGEHNLLRKELSYHIADRCAQWICRYFENPDGGAECAGAATVVFGETVADHVRLDDVYLSCEEITEEGEELELLEFGYKPRWRESE